MAATVGSCGSVTLCLLCSDVATWSIHRALTFRTALTLIPDLRFAICEVLLLKIGTLQLEKPRSKSWTR
jgi:hypothetical protein